MSIIKLEYIWIDGSKHQQIRSKTKITSEINSVRPSDYPIWSFDGSSTSQAKSGKGKNTDCLLKPVFVTYDPFRRGLNKLVFCEVLNPDGTPHETNNRRTLSQKVNELGIISGNKLDLPWFGWEQEYTLTHKPSNPFGIGEGREIVEEHMNMCMEIGLDISGINAEVLLGQWEYQIGPVTALEGSDQLWISRYLLQRVTEKHNVKVSLHPKPLKGDWNGTGCHVNFSTKEMREEGGLDIIKETMSKLEKYQKEHISVYGLHNDQRLTGAHETSSINDFSYGPTQLSGFLFHFTFCKSTSLDHMRRLYNILYHALSLLQFYLDQILY
jgi:glutamine synthetase